MDTVRFRRKERTGKRRATLTSPNVPHPRFECSTGRRCTIGVSNIEAEA